MSRDFVSPFTHLPEQNSLVFLPAAAEAIIIIVTLCLLLVKSSLSLFTVSWCVQIQLHVMYQRSLGII